jgi:hypothetical protein
MRYWIDMKAYCDSNAGSQIEPVLWNARESVWIISPWLGKDYAKRLALLSQKGIEVKIITSYVNWNIESLEILTASKNPNLRLLVIDKEKATFIHAKIYIVDNEYAVSGSANFTYSGLNSSVENLSIAENKEEVQKIRNNFTNMWMTFDGKCMSDEELSFGTSHSIRKALPLSINYGDIDYPNIKDKELVYHPYYFFEFSFRVPVGRSPPYWFEDSGLIVLDGANGKITNNNLLVEEIKNNPVTDYLLKPENKYRLTIHQQTIRDFREAKELVLNYIIEENTQQYEQHYGNRTYYNTFRPYRSVIRFVKSGFVQVPIWYIERHEPDGRKHQDIIFGSSKRKWNELLYCPECQKKIWINQAVNCKICGKQMCPDCINEIGLIFKKKLCSSCLSKSYS